MSDLPGITVEGSKPTAADDARQFEQQNMRALTDDLSAFNPTAETNAIAGQMPQPTADMQQAPQDHMGDLMKVAPIFMGMAALGGKVFRSHGIAMLASTNAMMKGFASGNEQQYKNAVTDYQKKWAELKDQQQNWFDTYKAVYTARKGQWDARIKATEAANRIVGEQDKSINAKDAIDEKRYATLLQTSQKANQFSQTMLYRMMQLDEKKRMDDAAIAEKTAKREKLQAEAGGGLSERALDILDAARNAGVSLSSLGRTKAMMVASLNHVAEKHPELSPEAIAQGWKSGNLSMKEAQTEATVLGRKEALTESGLSALNSPGGIFDQLQDVAKKINFGDSKTINNLQLAAQGKLVADPNIAAYRTLTEEAKTEVTSVLSRAGVPSDAVRRQADAMFPLNQSLGELQRSIQVSKAVGSAVISGNKRVMDAITNGQSMDQAAQVAGLMPPKAGNPNGGYKEGDTSKDTNGKPIVYVGGKWVYPQ